MNITNIQNIRKSKIRIFPFQTKDHAFILYPDLPTSYLLTLLIDKIGFKLNQFIFDYIYPTNTYTKKTLKNIGEYKEEYFIFYLENYFHSSEYALGFLELILKRISKQKNKPYIIIHTIKTPKKEINKLIKKYNFILLIVNGDFEEFFYDLFIKKKNISKIGNISYRDDNINIHTNKTENIKTDLNKYILPAYASTYYTNFPKNKDHIISIIDNDNKYTDKNIYYKWPKDKFIKKFRYSPDTSIMLSTGRGCKYNCSYCYRGVKYQTIRQIDLKIIKKDLDYLRKLKYKYIYFYDDCFLTTNLNRLDKIIKLLKQYNFSYGIAARYEVCTSENLLKLSKINIKRIQIGLQSISLGVNLETKRGFIKEDFEKTINKMKKLGINLFLDIILGLPGEGIKGFIKTFNYAVGLKPESIFINSLFLNPGTQLYQKQKKYGIISTNPSGKKYLFHVDSIASSNNFSKKDIEFARKYVSYYINKIRNIYIVLR